MKHKKLLFISVLIVLSLLLGACGSVDISKQSAYELIKNAVEKTSKLDSYEMDMKIKAVTEVFGEKIETPMDFSMKVEGASGNALKAVGKVAMNILGVQIDADYYQEGNTVYINISGNKLRLSADSADAKPFTFSDTEKSIIKALPEDVVKEVTNIQHDDGSRTVSVMIDGDTFMELFNELVSEYSNQETYAELMEDLKALIGISNANVTITVLPNGYISEYDIQFDMNVSLSSVTAGMDFTTKVSLDASIEFKDPGTKVTVTAPADQSEYQDYNAVSDK